MSSSAITATTTTTTPITDQSDTADMSSSADTTDQASYSNEPQEQTVTESPVPESTTVAETTSEPPTTTTTTTVMEATTIKATENQIEPTTQAHATTEAAEATLTTQKAQAYTASYNENQQYSQPTTDIQQQSIVPNPTLTLTETSIASISPTMVVITSSSGVSTVLSTSTCMPDSAATTSNVCSSVLAAQEANAAKMTVAQIAGIVVGVLGLFSLVVACILFKKRKNSKTNNKRRISPFFYMNDQHPDPEKSLAFDTSTAALCQSYKNEPPNGAPATNSSASDMSESVCGDYIFYSNSTDYRRSSSIMHQQGINEKLTVITTPTKSHHHTHTGYASSPLNMDASATISTPTTLYPHTKRSDSSEPYKQTSSYNPFSSRQQDVHRTSAEIDTDNYTLSAMQLFQSSSNRNTATTTTTTTTTATSRPISSAMGSFVCNSRQQYRPSLHDSMYLGSSCNNSSSDDSSTIRSLPMAQPPPPRFSRHHRQESSLDPHLYQQQQQQQQQPQQQQPYTMSLWDDHLN